MHRLWIASWAGTKDEDAEFLQSLGVALGSYDEESGDWVDCLLTEEVMEKLNPYWAKRFMWGPMGEGEWAR